MPFRAQGDHRLEPRGIARSGLRRVVLENTRENNPGLQLRERHPDAGARAASEGEVRSRRDLLAVRRIPALRFEHFRVLPDSGQAMNDPLAQDEQRPNRQAYAINGGLFGDEAHLQPGGWIQTHRFAQDPIEIGKFGEVVKGWFATGEDRANLILQFDAYTRMLGEEVKRPDEGYRGRFVTCRQEGQDVIVNLF